MPHRSFIYIIITTFLLSACSGKKGKDKPSGPPPPAPVTVHVVSLDALSQTLDLSGTLYAQEEITLKPEVSGRVTNVNFKEGSIVSKGQLLIKIYDGDLQAQKQKLETQRQLALKTLERQAALLKIHGISQQEYDLSNIQLSNINADISLIRAQLSKTEIRAPFSGRMGLTNVTEGTYVQAGVEIVNLQKTSTLKVEFSVPEKYESLIHLKERITFFVEGREGPFTAEIYALEPFITPETRTLKVRARFQNLAGLLPGVFAKVSLDLQDVPKAVVIPTQAIIPEARDKKVVRVVDGKAVFTVVETGVRTPSGIQIENGLNAGDTIVLTGLMQMKPGIPVKISKVVNGGGKL